MNTFIKTVITIALVAIVAAGLNLWYNTFIEGAYYQTAGIGLIILGLAAPILGLWLGIWLIIKTMKTDFRNLNLLLLATIGGSICLVGCDRAMSNMQTLVSDDCGVSWRLIAAGKTVPARIGPCALKVTVPNYPMQGEANFKVSFQHRVLVGVNVSYDYSITDALKFISNARYLGKQNSAGDGSNNSATLYESAENALIDRRIREVAANLLADADIVDFDQGAFEDKLLAKVNEDLGERGVQLSSMAFVPTPDVQTRQAIDVGAAVRVYKALGLDELGKSMMVMRAGAATVTVTNNDTLEAAKK